MAILQAIDKTVESTAESKAMQIVVDSRHVFDVYINAYVNKFAFIRELTANAFDATIEVWEQSFSHIPKNEFLANNPIIVSVNEDDAGQYIQIEETRGIGISPERMETYALIGHSTKRESVHQIGAKGIGRLSALAYQREYYLTTIYNGLRREYKVFYDGKEVQVAHQFDIPTDSCNRTMLRVYLKDFRNEKSTIEIYLRDSLGFVENLIVKNLKYDSKIPYYKSLPYCYIDLRQGYYGYGITMLIGNIHYEVPNGFLELIPQAKQHVLTQYRAVLKFDVSDIPLTLNRDSIQITDKACELFKSKVALSLAEIEKLEENAVTHFANKMLAIPLDSAENIVKAWRFIDGEEASYLDGNDRYFVRSKELYAKVKEGNPLHALLSLGEKHNRSQWTNRKTNNLFRNYKENKKYSQDFTHYIINPKSDYKYPNVKIHFILFEGLSHDDAKAIDDLLSPYFTPLSDVPDIVEKEDKNRVYGTVIKQERTHENIGSKEVFTGLIENIKHYYIYNAHDKSTAISFFQHVKSFCSFEIVLVKASDERMLKKLSPNIKPIDLNEIVDLEGYKIIHVYNNLRVVQDNPVFGKLSKTRDSLDFKNHVWQCLNNAIREIGTLNLTVNFDINLQPEEFIKICNDLNFGYKKLNEWYKKALVAKEHLPEGLINYLSESYYGGHYAHSIEAFEYLLGTIPSHNTITNDLAEDFCKLKEYSFTNNLSSLFTIKTN